MKSTIVGKTPSTASGPPSPEEKAYFFFTHPKEGGLLTFHYSLFIIHSSLRSTTPSTARREPPKLGKLTSGNPKARSPYLTTTVS